ncbi:MAG: AIR synthase related protein, partial [Gemmatimonadota bacterium]|nr:AIR synthase related protein [Gemmatimonadota bacterium]
MTDDHHSSGNGTSQPATSPNGEIPRPRPGDPPITPELVDDHGLSPDEYQQILQIMGREPTFTELGVFSAMWSEHCGYKNSKRLLRLLPTQAPWVIQGPGENAGVIDVGGGWALAFKIESHNHPSAVEPYQGAATGIGGILRDVFTMGARPVATLNSLHFGDLDRPRVRYLFSGVVKGIGDYGNCVGIPSTGGEVYFDKGYEDNPIVGHIVGIQDMGAAGLTSSGTEMAGRSGTGVVMDVARVPVREQGMTPYEILLSESQERMLVVAEAGREDAVREILEKWELEAETIGQVTATGSFRVLEDGVAVADIPALPLTQGCPTYERPGEESPEIRELRKTDILPHVSPPNGLESAFLAVVGSPNVASKQWVYEQYDTTVRANSIERPGGDAGVFRVPGTNRGVAAT